MAYGYYKQRSLKLGMTLEDTLKLQTKYPHMHTAYQIHTARDYFRYILEAMIVANVDQQEIAKEFGCSAEVVDIFEKVYFDVRTRLGAPLFIADELLGPLFSGDTSGSQDCDFLWKSVAYYCGIDILKSFWSIEKASPETTASIKELFKTKLQQQAYSSLFSRAPNSYNAHEIVEEYLADQEQEPEVEEETVDNKLEEQALNLLDSIKLRMISYDTKKGAKEGRALQEKIPEE